MQHRLTETPTALAGLTAGTRYEVQNQSRISVRVLTATSAPSHDAPSFIFGSGEFFEVRRNDGENIYVWVRDARFGAGQLFYGEAV